MCESCYVERQKHRAMQLATTLIPKKKIEVHPDGVKEVKCEFCDVNCGNEWCCMKEQK